MNDQCSLVLLEGRFVLFQALEWQPCWALLTQKVDDKIV